MTVQALIGEHLGVFFFEQKVIQKHPRILRLKVSRLKQIEFSGLLNRILKRDFYVLGPTQGSEGEGAIRKLELFLSLKEFDSKLYKCSGPVKTVPFYFFFILISKEILMNSPCS